MVDEVSEEPDRAEARPARQSNRGMDVTQTTQTRPVEYLSGERVYLRALVMEDKDQAAAWFDSPFPVNATRAEEYLKEQHQAMPWIGRRYHLAICRRASGEVIGGALLRTDHRTGHAAFHMAPWLEDADELRAEALRLVVTWLRDDHELMSITVPIAADEERTLAAARELGMAERVRLRRFVARPGGRVDLLHYQLVNPWREAFEHA